MTIVRKQDLNCSTKWQFAASFIHLELMREHKKDYVSVGENKAGFDYKIVKVMCSLEGNYTFKGVLILASRRCVNLNAQELGTGLA